jgi:hypothetical protein
MEIKFIPPIEIPYIHAFHCNELFININQPIRE